MKDEKIEKLKEDNEKMKKEIQQAVDGYIAGEFAYKKVEKYEAIILGFKWLLQKIQDIKKEDNID